MELSWIVLLPPLAVIAIACLTHNVLYALLSGVITASLIACQGNIGASATLLLKKFGEATSLTDLWHNTACYDHAYTLGFLVALGIIIELITHAGGLEAYGRLMHRWITRKKQVEAAPLFLSPLFFLDDYLNNLVGGAIVRPLFDQFHLARAKLAYMLNALSSSQSLLIPASSWLAFIVMQLQSAGISCAASSLITADAFTLYVQTIPYLLYPILSIASVWIVVGLDISYGPMEKAEEKAREHTYVNHQESRPKGTLSNFFIPLLSFLGGIPVALLILAQWHPWQTCTTLCGALANTDALFSALWWASIGALCISSIYLYATSALTASKLRTLFLAGASSMKSSVLLLTLAWMFASFLKHDVPTGAYLAKHLMNHAPHSIIPALCFVTATLITAIAGSSWGMIGIMIPLVLPLVTTMSNLPTPLLPALIPLLLPVLGAVLSGAAAGPHISPITDAAIISSATAQITPIQHIRTMLPYCVPPLLCTLAGFLALPFLLPLSFIHMITFLALLIVAMALLHITIQRLFRKTGKSSVS